MATIQHKVLVVDDNIFICDALTSGLRRMGYLTQRVGSGEDAAVVAKWFKPHIVLMDHCMPGGMSGPASITLLRKTPSFEGARFVGLAYTEKNRHEFFEAGAKAVLFKPFRLGMVRIALEDIVAGREHSSVREHRRSLPANAFDRVLLAARPRLVMTLGQASLDAA